MKMLDSFLPRPSQPTIHSASKTARTQAKLLSSFFRLQVSGVAAITLHEPRVLLVLLENDRPLECLWEQIWFTIFYFALFRSARSQRLATWMFYRCRWKESLRKLSYRTRLVCVFKVETIYAKNVSSAFDDKCCFSKRRIYEAFARPENRCVKQSLPLKRSLFALTPRHAGFACTDRIKYSFVKPS